MKRVENLAWIGSGAQVNDHSSRSSTSGAVQADSTRIVR